MTILVIDGQGGKLGKSLIESLKKTFPQVEIMAVGTNSTASEAMRRAGADHAATGENPVLVACRRAQIIVGPIGIAIADALIPMNLCSTYVAGVKQRSSDIIDDAMAHIRHLLEQMELPQ